MGGNTIPLTFRLGTPDDANRCGTICYEAFKTIAEQHHFPSDFPSPRWLSPTSRHGYPTRDTMSSLPSWAAASSAVMSWMSG
jgi:hypothetical protein